MRYIFKNYPRTTYLMLAIVNAMLFIAIFGNNLVTKINLQKILVQTRDFEENSFNNKLKVGVQFKAAELFLNDGKPCGYLYDMIREFSNHLKVDFELVALTDEKDKVNKLQNGVIDVVAGINQQQLKAVEESAINLSEPIFTSQLVLLQRKNSINDNIKKIKNLNELKNLDVYLTNNFKNNANVNLLADDKNMNVWVLDENVSQFDLIEDVISEKVDYAIVENHFAKLFTIANKNLDANLLLTESENITWATLKSSKKLTDKLNKWLANKNDNLNLFTTYLNYYKENSEHKFNNSIATNASLAQYDDLVIKYAKAINMDWQLVAAIINQESSFRFDVKSKSGAMGLMQVMPTTGKGYGITDLYDPELNIKAGTAHLKWLDNFWSKRISNKEEKLNFILASYNCGAGHVEDARRLAEKYGNDPNKWHNNVDEFIVKKSKKQYYKDEVVKHGFCNGNETYYYVLKVLNKYYNYKLKYSNKLVSL